MSYSFISKEVKRFGYKMSKKVLCKDLYSRNVKESFKKAFGFWNQYIGLDLGFGPSREHRENCSEASMFLPYCRFSPSVTVYHRFLLSRLLASSLLLRIHLSHWWCQLPLQNADLVMSSSWLKTSNDFQLPSW